MVGGYELSISGVEENLLSGKLSVFSSHVILTARKLQMPCNAIQWPSDAKRSSGKSQTRVDSDVFMSQMISIITRRYFRNRL